MGFAANKPPIWPVAPDWSEGVQETLSWSTEVLRGDATALSVHTGLRLGPRRSLSFRILAGAREKRVAAMLLAGHSGQWLLPVWPDVQCLPATVTAGDVNIACDTAGRDFVAGGQALLYTDVTTWEAVDVASVTGSQLQLTAPVSAAVAAGARLYPLRLARLQGDAEETHLSDDVSRRTLTFNIRGASEWPSLTASTLYLGHPVLTVRPDESTDPASTLERLLKSVDYGSAQPFVHDISKLALRTQQSHWKLFGRDEHTWFRSLLYTLEGRGNPVWVPSWAADLKPLFSVPSNSTTLQVEWAGYTLYGLGRPNRRDLRIELQDGTVLYRRIIDATAASAVETLMLDQPLANTAIPAARIRMISFLALCTLASDDIELQHITDADGVATVTTGWSEVVPDAA
ncbi:hypothetical protein ABE493_07885 [Stenotrophomonas terrae]|uniref:hypothetical protein n=1 Tax=Stenotrophomonas terrae TaxID=405446 RepID=UPI0032094D7E